MTMRSNSLLRIAGALALSGALGALPGCFDDNPAPPPAHPPTVVGSPGVASPQPAPGPTVIHVQDSPTATAPPAAPAPTIINNVVPGSAAAPAPTVAPAPTSGTTVNVQPKTVNVP